MVSDAEEHAAEDAKLRGLIDKRNQAEQLIHATEKSLSDLARTRSRSPRSPISRPRSPSCATAVAGEDADEIDAKSAALGEVTGKLAERAYANQNGTGDAGEPGAQAANDADDDAVDAEFEEVKEDKAS